MASTNLPLDGRFNTSRGEQNIGIPPTQIAPRPTEFGILTLEKVRKAAMRHIDLRKHVAIFSNYEDDIARCGASTNQHKTSTHPSECYGTPAITRNYSTCALVGNGGILLNSSCGEAVDSHDFVIRLNLPPVQSFERDVGSRTDLVSINNKVLIDIGSLLISSTGRTEVLKMLNQVQNSILLYAKGFEKHGKGAYNITTLEAIQSVDNFIESNGLQIRTAYGLSDDVQAASKRVISRLRETVRHPTTGFLNYFLSLAFCDHVTVYGFWPFAMTPDHRPLPYHYFDNETFPINHNIIDEQVFLRDLNETGCLTLVRDCL
ncbi:alpha-2,8-sialyltransferase 8B-like isoform X1 [Branchiostoma floridae]|uniref:Alpha-2,8-sialyltransferase 8B-like isoform X1 n=1 Tax=Branchiostoma floridae TaxID=7739 RepID=A0A9J7KVE9_BRAFL|nr:alpha-2,8-sialyltransferase 8B-like isoform X1 [Branchiostoma floridae]